MKLDLPVRQVLPDLAILGIAQRQPKNDAELLQARGVDGRVQRGAVASEILAAVQHGLSGPPPEVPTSGDDIERDLRPAVTLISAWVSQVAKTEGVDTAMLATRATSFRCCRAIRTQGWHLGGELNCSATTFVHL